MGANLWGGSRLWEYRLGLNVSKDNHELKATARPRGLVQRKPECKRCEATDRNRIVNAEGCEASWHRTAKPTGMQLTENAALVHRQFTLLSGEICAPRRRAADGRDGRVMRYPKRPGAGSRSPISSERTGPDPSGHTARPAVMHRVRPQKYPTRRRCGGARLAHSTAAARSRMFGTCLSSWV